MKILLLAGEESGLIYADELKRRLSSAHEIRSFLDYGFKTSDLAVMGFGAVLKKLPYFMRVKKTMEKAIDEWQPDVVCTIDYPGLNMRLASYAKTRGVRCVHVVCPQVWAWKAGRIPKIEASFDALACFFPFEPALFKKGFASFVGHPLAESFDRLKVNRDEHLIALLPGSRLGEIERNFPLMLESFAVLLKENNALHAIVPAANHGARIKIEAILKKYNFDLSRVKIQDGNARGVLSHAYVALVASGTATLEAALARCPTALVYKVSPILASFARAVIKGVKHIGLVNIIWEKSGEKDPSPMPELVQEDFTVENTTRLLRAWLNDAEERARVIKRLDDVVSSLETSDGAFSKIIALITSKNI